MSRHATGSIQRVSFVPPVPFLPYDPAEQDVRIRATDVKQFAAIPDDRRKETTGAIGPEFPKREDHSISSDRSFASRRAANTAP